MFGQQKYRHWQRQLECMSHLMHASWSRNKGKCAPNIITKWGERKNWKHKKIMFFHKQSILPCPIFKNDKHPSVDATMWDCWRSSFDALSCTFGCLRFWSFLSTTGTSLLSRSLSLASCKFKIRIQAISFWFISRQ